MTQSKVPRLVEIQGKWNFNRKTFRSKKANNHLHFSGISPYFHILSRQHSDIKTDNRGDEGCFPIPLFILLLFLPELTWKSCDSSDPKIFTEDFCY